MTTYTVIATIPAKDYDDHDDCLTVALADAAEDLAVEEWEIEARWNDDDTRENIVIVRRS